MKQMFYMHEQPVMSVIFVDGSVPLMSLSYKVGKEDVHLGFNFAHFFKKGLPNPKNIEVVPDPGPISNIIG